ncbi:MAG: Crp/Fnr family transcriptional regulator [Rhodospirillales bacterium]|nr:Crp/Fnr family transcriptional regulator [Rhodospirillales bacterium]
MLARMRLFGGTDDADLDDVASHAKVRVAERGDILFERGDQAEVFYGVISGWVKLYNPRADGTEAVIGIFTQSETFAEATLFMAGVYPATAEAIAPTRLFEFEREYFAEKFLSNPVWCRGMFASLSMHLHRMTREIEQLQNRSSEQRLARFLLMLCHDEESGCTLQLPYEKALIANRLGMKPETLSRNFQKLRSCGVRVERDKVVVGDVKRLRAHCV